MICQKILGQKWHKFWRNFFSKPYLTKTNFKEAIFNGAYLNGAKLTGAELGGAIYDKKTRFDTSFNPETVLMNMGDDEKAS